MAQPGQPSPLSQSEILYEFEHINDNRSPDLTISWTICISLAYLAVLLRLIARKVSKAGLKADDYTIILALVRIPISHHSKIEILKYFSLYCYTHFSQIISSGQLAVGLYAVYLGMGKHIVLIKNVESYAKVSTLHRIGS